MSKVNKDIEKFKQKKKLLERAKPRIEICLPKGSYFNAERLLAVMQSELRKTPKLLDCNDESLGSAMMLAARLGLEPDSALGHFYILPYKDKANIILGYRGLIELAMRSPHVKSIYAQEVYEGDRFDVTMGSDKKIVHIPDMNPKMENGKVVAKQLIAVYAVAEYINGAKEIEVMPRYEVDNIRGRSKTSGFGPWVTDYAAMARKSVLRRMCKYIPMCIDAQKASAIEEGLETGREQLDDWVEVDAEVEVVEDKPQSQNLADKLME